MPLNARECRIAVEVAPKKPGIPADIVEAIDELLRPDWQQHELWSNDKDDDIGRHYVCTDMEHSIRREIIQQYQLAGWEVNVCGAHNTSAYTDPNSPSGKFRSLRFTPRYLREKLVSQMFPGR